MLFTTFFQWTNLLNITTSHHVQIYQGYHPKESLSHQEKGLYQETPISQKAYTAQSSRPNRHIIHRHLIPRQCRRSRRRGAHHGIRIRAAHGDVQDEIKPVMHRGDPRIAADLGFGDVVLQLLVDVERQRFGRRAAVDDHRVRVEVAVAIAAGTQGADGETAGFVAWAVGIDALFMSYLVSDVGVRRLEKKRFNDARNVILDSPCRSN